MREIKEMIIMPRPLIAITIGKQNYARMFNQRAWDALAAFGDVIHHPGNEPANKNDLLALLRDADACITSWDVAPIDAEVLNAAPRLRALAHMGGSVKRFVSDAVWARGLRVTTAGPALARDVAETALGLMIAGIKHIVPLGQHVRDGGWRESKWFPSRELFASTVGIVGASNVGRTVIELLKPFRARVLVFDPFLSDADARELDVIKVELDDLCRASDIVSIHAPDKPATRRMIGARQLALMKDRAILINTARGTLIDEPALVAELARGRFFAFLDVTDPEPPALDSPLRTLPNVIVTPHIAGCIENCSRLGEMAVEELRRFFAGEPAIYPITPEMFARIA
jgi:phosphoglycerate dehydrogenase-like enzyme